LSAARGHPAARRRDRRGRGIDSDDARALAGKPRALERRAAAELDDVEAVDVADPLVGDTEDAPDEIVTPPRALGLLICVLRVRQRPLRDVRGDALVSRAHRRRTRARSRAVRTPVRPRRSRGW